MYDDDDAPPPLSSLPEQLEAVKLRDQGVPSTSGRAEHGSEEEALRVATTVVIKPGSSSVNEVKAAPALKKGFFDAKPAKSKPKPATAKAPDDDGIPLLKGKKAALGGGTGAKVPDFMRVEPDEAAKQYEQVRGKLVEALKPTPDMVEGIMRNPDLLAGFEDPEVMAAVSDVAQNPQNMKKYADNKKVLAFYSAMGAMAGQKLEKMGDTKLAS
mmetsp:Transcript_9278/g.22994  ORF Transcript_9278/g.22994 Transcript_9278/m.22994 type:complete len:213 (-) Transcript_9278:72-710(-)|eukprot:CAMPEP_0202875912 /NCGR_PEP_ID=MMETSP1391-20130828/28129_1 /ASSEMBLY_ACC=CAM_ASM_000867 /TAXON_ID=1034604 /ORGANISM="Chlamydomonas leiostraca, Strain SAG 11-49" /LENGTH=212 /DNA_ID=CAMNT_0049557667 /DNA_START=34 /DNA_END=672 /DNA_ORIENTATION=-